MNLPENIKLALRILQENGFKAGVVGGCVRDFIMNNNPHDYDITTNAKPDEIKRIFNSFKIIDTNGEKHGTVVVLINKESVEITTFRVDGDYSDGRRPDMVNFTNSLEQDLLRRDFTMNALFYDKTNIVDLFNGVNDIQNKIIRAVGNADERFKEDSLRILRALRFASKYGFIIEPETKKAMIKNKSLLKNVSVERISSEFSQILSGPYCVSILEEYVDIIIEFIPELKQMINCPQHNKHHIYDVWNHTLKSISALDSLDIFPEEILKFRLIMLFHDIGKPNTLSTDENGWNHFYKHPTESENITKRIFERLKISNSVNSKILKEVLILIKYHDIEVTNKKNKIIKAIITLDRNIETFNDWIVVKQADSLAQNLIISKEHLEKLDMIKSSFLSLKKNNNIIVNLNQLNISGKDLINLGLKGKDIGIMLNNLLHDVAFGNLLNEKEILKNSVIKRISKK